MPDSGADGAVDSSIADMSSGDVVDAGCTSIAREKAWRVDEANSCLIPLAAPLADVCLLSHGGGADSTMCLFGPDESLYFVFSDTSDTVVGTNWTGMGDTFTAFDNASPADRQRCTNARAAIDFSALDVHDAGALAICGGDGGTTPSDGGAEAD